MKCQKQVQELGEGKFRGNCSGMRVSKDERENLQNAWKKFQP
jgi:hypothetical protein